MFCNFSFPNVQTAPMAENCVWGPVISSAFKSSLPPTQPYSASILFLFELICNSSAYRWSHPSLVWAPVIPPSKTSSFTDLYLHLFENLAISSVFKTTFAQNHLSGLFEYHTISYTSKPNLCVARGTVVFEPYAISFFHWLTMPSLFERHAISSASKTIRRG